MLHPWLDHGLGVDRDETEGRLRLLDQRSESEADGRLLPAAVPRCEDADLDQRAVLCLNTSTYLQYTGPALLTVMFAQLTIIIGIIASQLDIIISTIIILPKSLTCTGLAKKWNCFQKFIIPVYDHIGRRSIYQTVQFLVRNFECCVLVFLCSDKLNHTKIPLDSSCGSSNETSNAILDRLQPEHQLTISTIKHPLAIVQSVAVGSIKKETAS